MIVEPDVTDGSSTPQPSVAEHAPSSAVKDRTVARHPSDESGETPKNVGNRLPLPPPPPPRNFGPAPEPSRKRGGPYQDPYADAIISDDSDDGKGKGGKRGHNFHTMVDMRGKGYYNHDGYVDGDGVQHGFGEGRRPRPRGGEHAREHKVLRWIHGALRYAF